MSLSAEIKFGFTVSTEQNCEPLADGSVPFFRDQPPGWDDGHGPWECHGYGWFWCLKQSLLPKNMTYPCGRSKFCGIPLKCKSFAGGWGYRRYRIIGWYRGVCHDSSVCILRKTRDDDPVNILTWDRWLSHRLWKNVEMSWLIRTERRENHFHMLHVYHLLAVGSGENLGSFWELLVNMLKPRNSEDGGPKFSSIQWTRRAKSIRSSR